MTSRDNEDEGVKGDEGKRGREEGEGGLESSEGKGDRGSLCRRV